MYQVQKSDKKIGYSNEQQIVIVHDSAGVPGKGEYTAGYDNAEYFCKAVEEQVIIKADDGKNNKKRKPQEHGVDFIPGGKFFLHHIHK
jgi:hypothetical protein